ncbi:MAG: hypothetical protein ACTHLF_21340, partial [Luteibacter sp.]
MTTHDSRNLSGRALLDQMTRRPVSRAVGACLIAVGIAGCLVTPAASAQSVPQPNTSPWIVNQAGSPGADQSGAQGGSTSGIDVDTDTLIYPSIYLSSVGGSGGTGQDSDSKTGPGGRGGNSGVVSLNMPEADVSSTNVATADNPNAAVWLRSVGGTGGAAGKMLSSFGYPGMPGAGGDSGGVSFTQNWNVFSTSGWNGNQAGTTAVLLQSIGGDAGQPLLSDGADGSGKVTGPDGNT